MDFKVTYTKLSNHFFYLQNMSLWRPFCHKEYNMAWNELTGEISTKEERVLQELKNILQEDKKITEIMDYIYNKAIVPPDEKIENILRVTKSSFEKIWENIKNDLPKAKNNFEILLNKYSETIKETLDILRNFYNSQKKPLDCTNILLILLPENIKSGGGKFAPENNIILEGSLRRFNNPITIEIALHEMIHLYFEDYFKNELYPKFEKEIEYHPLKETVAAALLPYGYFSHKFFNVSPKQPARNYQLIKLAENYIESSKIIDDSFVKQCVDFIKRKPG